MTLRMACNAMSSRHLIVRTSRPTNWHLQFSTSTNSACANVVSAYAEVSANWWVCLPLVLATSACKA